jgi:hypothetical protein
MVVDIETFENYVGGTDLFDKVRKAAMPLWTWPAEFGAVRAKNR